MTSRFKKASYTTIVGLGLFAGAVGIAAAANGDTTPTPAPPAVVTPAAPTDAAGTPAATETPDANEATEAIEAPEALGDNEATEAPEAAGSDEADGIDHENDGEETGNNGDGVAEANDATEAP